MGDDASPTDGPEATWLLYVYDFGSSVAIVALIGVLLFTASGVWPPMVAVESGSMEPVIERGDLVYVMEPDRFAGPDAKEGIVTAAQGRENGYSRFDGPGDVIVYEPGGNSRKTPIIHRAMFWVEDGENWVKKANPAYLPRNAKCEASSTNDEKQDVPNCPAPHAGFITKGDNNANYDQVNQIMRQEGPVKPGWIVGTAELYVPYLGQIRLGV